MVNLFFDLHAIMKYVSIFFLMTNISKYLKSIKLWLSTLLFKLYSSAPSSMGNVVPDSRWMPEIYRTDSWREVKVAQSCPTLCDPKDYTVHAILQARILEWVAVPFSRASSHPRDRTQVSHIAGGFFTSWATSEAQEYWNE